MIDEILTKARQGKELSDEEFLELLNIDDDEDLEKLFKVACDIRDSQSKVIKLTSTVHLTNKCQIQPRCEYCGFAEETSEKGYYNAFYKSNDEILMAVKSMDIKENRQSMHVKSLKETPIWKFLLMLAET